MFAPNRWAMGPGDDADTRKKTMNAAGLKCKAYRKRFHLVGAALNNMVFQILRFCSARPRGRGEEAGRRYGDDGKGAAKRSLLPNREYR